MRWETETKDKNNRKCAVQTQFFYEKYDTLDYCKFFPYVDFFVFRCFFFYLCSWNDAQNSSHSAKLTNFAAINVLIALWLCTWFGLFICFSASEKLRNFTFIILQQQWTQFTLEFVRLTLMLFLFCFNTFFLSRFVFPISMLFHRWHRGRSQPLAYDCARKCYD